MDTRSDEFPREWAQRLHAVSPKTDLHSYLVPVWYRAGQRWVLYEATPRAWILDHLDAPVVPTLTGRDVRDAMDGPRPSSLTGGPVRDLFSDVQWELWRSERAFCLPFFVLQGPDGGHLVHFTEFQQQLLRAQHLRPTPPPLGHAAYERQMATWRDEEANREDGYPHPVEYAPCAFDRRTERQLMGFNRLWAAQGNLDALRKSGARTSMEAEERTFQQEIRRAQLQALEQFLLPAVEVARTLRSKSTTRDNLVYLDGEASRSADRLDHYLATGEFIA